MMNEENEVKKFPWLTVNIIIFAVCFLGACFWLLALGASMRVIPVIMLSNAGAGILTYNGKLKKLRLTLRGISIAAFAVLVSLPFVVKDFEHTKLMYPVKSRVYSLNFAHGQDLPAFLPKKCRDYTFITQPQTFAQDYHPSSYLMFYTDQATIMKLEQRYISNGYVEKELEPLTEEEIKDRLANGYSDDELELAVKSAESGMPSHVVYRMMKNGYTSGISQPKTYIFHSYYTKGFYCDKDTGLVVIWT